VGLALLDDRLSDYGDHVRSDLIALLPVPLGSVLDVGCARGEAAALLRGRGAQRLAGVELDPAYAALARGGYDEVVCGSVEGDLPWPARSFETILCYDVLEHLVDPWRTLTRLGALLSDGGRIHISVPNARHPGTWLPLVARGTFDYRAQGLRDVTHLRFFARRDLRAMVEASNLELGELDVVPAASRSMKLALALTRGRAKEFAAYQWYAIATPRRGRDQRTA
jgi:SAM-dependent methyltransferase